VSKSLQKVRQLAKCMCQARQKASKSKALRGVRSWCDLGAARGQCGRAECSSQRGGGAGLRRGSWALLRTLAFTVSEAEAFGRVVSRGGTGYP